MQSVRQHKITMIIFFVAFISHSYQFGRKFSAFAFDFCHKATIVWQNERSLVCLDNFFTRSIIHRHLINDFGIGYCYSVLVLNKPQLLIIALVKGDWFVFKPQIIGRYTLYNIVIQNINTVLCKVRHQFSRFVIQFYTLENVIYIIKV